MRARKCTLTALIWGALLLNCFLFGYALPVLGQSIDNATSLERKTKDAQLTVRATAVAENILVEDDKFQVPPGKTVAWEVELSVYNSEGRRFESCRARQLFRGFREQGRFLYRQTYRLST